MNDVDLNTLQPPMDCFQRTIQKSNDQSLIEQGESYW